MEPLQRLELCSGVYKTPASPSMLERLKTILSYLFTLSNTLQPFVVICRSPSMLIRPFLIKNSS